MAPAEVAGRQFDYPVAANLQYKPRGEAGQNNIDFATLRALADPTQGGLDLVRLAIETRKDQMAAQKWTVKPRRVDENDKSPLTPGEKSLVYATKSSLRRPDGTTPFRTWQRMLLEDLLVIDAATIYLAPGPQANKRPEVMDGATIKRLIDPSGRTPIAPEPAYQQTLKGLPAVHYTTAEMVYSPRNPRPDRFYGMSPTEQVISTINIALRRQLSQLEYYTAGSVPDSVFGVPDNWSASQIQQFQAYWDSLLSGNTEERRRARFVPGGVKPAMLKPDQLKDEYDEWLARIICYCYSLSPGALIRDMNRATAETATNTARLEGLEPLKLWFGDVMDEVLEKGFADGASLMWGWADEEITNPESKARVFQIAMGGKPWMTADEVRSEYGQQPLTDEQEAQLAPPPPPSMFGGGFSASPEPEPKEPPPATPPAPPPPPAPATESVADVLRAATDGMAKVLGASLQKKQPQVEPVNHARADVKKAEAQILKVCSAFFSKLKASAVDAATGLQGINGAMDVVDGANYSKLREELAPLFAEIAQSGAKAGMLQVFPTQRLKRLAKAKKPAADDLSRLLDLANQDAIAWADEHAAELVGMHKNPDGSYSVSKQPGISISHATREMVRALTEKAVEEGWSTDTFAGELEDSGAFAESRSEMIARTETAIADLEGNRIGWKESGGVVGRRWSVAQDEVCDDCLAMANEVVGIEDEFPGGNPPLHPNCRCDEIPILSEESDVPEEESIDAGKMTRIAQAKTIERACCKATDAVAMLSERLERLPATPTPVAVEFQRDEHGRIVSAITKPVTGAP